MLICVRTVKMVGCWHGYHSLSDATATHCLCLSVCLSYRASSHSEPQRWGHLTGPLHSPKLSLCVHDASSCVCCWVALCHTLSSAWPKPWSFLRCQSALATWQARLPQHTRRAPVGEPVAGRPAHSHSQVWHSPAQPDNVSIKWRRRQRLSGSNLMLPPVTV